MRLIITLTRDLGNGEEAVYEADIWYEGAEAPSWDDPGSPAEWEIITLTEAGEATLILDPEVLAWAGNELEEMDQAGKLGSDAHA